MIENLFKLISNEFQLMLKGSVFSFVLYCMLIISCAIFALSLNCFVVCLNPSILDLCLVKQNSLSRNTGNTKLCAPDPFPNTDEDSFF